MKQPQLSKYLAARKPSVLRQAQQIFSKRKDEVTAINVGIGNISMPMHPAMINRMAGILGKNSPFKHGVVKYSSTAGLEETNKAILNFISASGFKTNHLYSQITDGSSQGMELVILGTCAGDNHKNKKLLLIEPSYSNYQEMAKRLGVPVETIKRELGEDGYFSLPDLNKIEKTIKRHRPAALVVIAYDNPTGQFLHQGLLIELAKLCVKYNLWIISDEAYRELNYTKDKTVSIWGITEKKVPGITGRRISLESASKLFNACGLRIGSIVTDNKEFHQHCVYENNLNLCANVLGQYVFGAIANQSTDSLQKWFLRQKKYYQKILFNLANDIQELIPETIVAKPQASIYLVVDLKNIVDKKFQVSEFVNWCASEGKVKIKKKYYTLLVAPLTGFYSKKNEHLGRTQFRIACVASKEEMRLVPMLLRELLEEYLLVGD
jgi:aspartate aminotransferase